MLKQLSTVGATLLIVLTLGRESEAYYKAQQLQRKQQKMEDPAAVAKHNAELGMTDG